MFNTSISDSKKAVTVLRQGGVIAFPTETTYGLGADPRNQKAVEQIYKIKGRDHKKPLLLVAGSWAQVELVARLSSKVHAFLKEGSRWPGPLTIILPVKEEVHLVQGVAVNGEVSVRYSSSSTVRYLTRAFGFPIIATSANVSGQPDNHSAEGVRASGLQIDYIVDGGALPPSPPSTLARIHDDGHIEIIRQGAMRLPKQI